MKLTKLSLAMAGILGAGMATEALALDLYVDTKTQQIFAEPGKGRVLLGEFQKVGEAATATAPKAETSELKAEIQQIKEELALKTNELKAIDEHIKDPKEGKLEIGEKGIKFESKDGNFEMALNGRMQVDSQMNVADASPFTGSTPTSLAPTTSGLESGGQLADGVNIRRARLGVEGKFFKEFEYKFEYDFSRGNGTVAAGITDAYINWIGYDPLGVKIGTFKEPFSLEEATSNRWITFIERNMAVNAFSDNPNAYKTGLGLTWSQPRWTAAGAIMTEPVGAGWGYTSSNNGNGNNNRNGASGDMGWDLTGRVTGLPWFKDKTKFLHVGASASERYVNMNKCTSDGKNPASCTTGMSFNSTVNGNVDRTSILNTGLLRNLNGSRSVDTITRMGGETAVVYGPFSAQAEYIQTDLNGNGYGNETLYGYYGYASYFLTGESRAYKAKTGAWDRLKPSRNFDMKGGIGAWELAAGYDFLDLNDKSVQGGRASTAKFGVNWYPNSHIKVMANYIHVLDVQLPNTKANNAASVTPGASFDGSNLDMFEMRGQVDF